MSQNQYSNHNNRKSGIPWWAIVLCFCFGLWPVGVILIILKLGRESGAFSSRQGRDYYDSASQSGAWNTGRRQDPWQQSDASQTVRTDANSYEEQKRTAKQATARSRAGTSGPARNGSASSTQPKWGSVQHRMSRQMGKFKEAKLLTIIGAIVMAVFGFSTIMTLADSFSYLFYEPLWLVEDILPLFIFTGVGAGLFTWGRVKQSQAKRYRRYVTLIGDQGQVSISALAAAYPAKRDACCTTLENMIEDGILGEGAYLDYGRDLLVLDGSGVRPQPEEQSKKKKKTAPETDIGEENALLRQIRAVNEAIENPEMSRKIERVEEITQRILEFQREHPEKSGELRKFLNYYLPTTLKILNSYAELEKQGVEGENIAATKKRIENMMDMVVEGFERQLDKLFAGDMMDIAADITVMEQMMQGDGLFDGDGDGMGLGGPLRPHEYRPKGGE